MAPGFFHRLATSVIALTWILTLRPVGWRLLSWTGAHPTVLSDERAAPCLQFLAGLGLWVALALTLGGLRFFLNWLLTSDPNDDGGVKMLFTLKFKSKATRGDVSLTDDP